MAETGRPVTIGDLAQILLQRSKGLRKLTAVVGPPGAGKSTFAAALAERLNQGDGSAAAILSMDGYHFDDNVLRERGLTGRKGAPETFDVAGLRHMLQRLRANVEEEIAVPVFDRALEISRAGAQLVPRAVANLIVEGNYLLLDRSPWCELHSLFDTTVLVSAPQEVLQRRLVERWLGLGFSPEQAQAKVGDNDVPNGRIVLSGSIDAEFVIVDKLRARL